MSDIKRVPLQTLESLESLGHGAKKERKAEKGKQLAPSLRFTLALPESNEKACPEFSYADLLKSAEKKRRKELKKGDENTTNGLDPCEEDDREKLQEIAKRLEAKYGTATAGRKKHNKYDDYVDLGAGYDVSDSFIDNTDAYDEIVPEDMTTARGGFYINSGPLEFKTAEGNSLAHHNNNNEDESSESSEEDQEEVGSPNRTDKRRLSSSDEEESEETACDQPHKKPKLEEKATHDGLMQKKKKQEMEMLARRKTVVRDLLKVKREALDTEVTDENDEKKRSEKSEFQKPKPTVDKKLDIRRFEKKSSSNGLDVKKQELKKMGRNIVNTIESVINAGRADDESSRETTDSGKSRGSAGSDSECDDNDKESAETLLPDSLTEDMKEIVSKLKIHAKNSKEGKTKFFNGPVNSGLFSLEKKLRLLSTSVRLQTYAHLARYLPCGKVTLVNRAKKLYLQDVEDKVKTPLEKLKAVIEKTMPTVMEKFTKECQRVAEEKGFDGSPSDVESSDGEDSAGKSSDKNKIPRRRFPWNDETKKLVCEIATARRQYFEVLRPRKESVESFVSNFMDEKVRPLWPPGWVRLQTLMKYSNPQPAVKRKPKKPKEISVPTSNSNVTVAMTVSNSSAKVDSHAMNSVITFSQERVKTPTNFSKTSGAPENPINFALTAQGAKTNEVSVVHGPGYDKKQLTKHRDKNRESPLSNQYSAPSSGPANSAPAKVSVVPATQISTSKSKLSEIFNPMDLTSSSLSIIPVNDFQKFNKVSESKKDMVSIRPYSDAVPEAVAFTQVTHALSSKETLYSALSQVQQSYSTTNQSTAVPTVPKPVPSKHRIFQDGTEARGDRRADEKDSAEVHKTEKKERKEKRSAEIKHKLHESKRRKKDLKIESVEPAKAITPPGQPLLSREEQEQRQIEETMAATNILSQIIEDDIQRPSTEKGKDTVAVLDDATGNIVIQSTEQEKDVQMVMRSLKELQELQEMNYSPSHSPVSSVQKAGKSSAANIQYVGYQEDFQRICQKKEEKSTRLTKKEDCQW